MTAPTEILAQEAAMSIHLLAGTYLDQGFTMDQTLKILHAAVDLVPELESESTDQD